MNEIIKNIDDLKTRLVIINQDHNRIEVPDKTTLKKLVVTLESQDRQFFIVEVDVKRSRKSEIRRTERINVKKLARKSTTSRESESKSPKESKT